MTILTHAMKTARIPEEFPAVKVFFPCNEGIGDSMTCVVTGAVIPDSGTTTYDTPHAPEFLTGENITTTGLSNVRLGKRGIALAIYEQSAIVAALCAQKLGSASTSIGLSPTDAYFTVNGNTQQLATGSTAAQGDIVGVAVGWDETEAHLYYSEDADFAFVSTTPLSAGSAAALAAGVYLPEAATIHQITRGAVYGWLIISFENSALPDAAELLAGINWMKDHWLAGDKNIYPAWSTLA